MNRLLIAALLAMALGVLLAVTLKVDTNPNRIFGEDAAPITALETEAGRQGAVLIRAEDKDLQHRIAGKALEALAHPSVERLSKGPETGNPAVLDWLFLHRFRLAPPEPDDLTAEAMAQRLTEAVALLTSSEGIVLGDRLLRDPTGSFSRLIGTLDGLRPELNSDGGFWQGSEGGALIFVTFRDQPLDARAMGALVRELRGLSDGDRVSVHLAGPRFISTEVSAATERGATLAGGIAGALLLLWLLFALRDWRGFGAVLLPLVLGLGTATLAVQMIFGSVHVIALGFGGALAGLALDYPLHLAGHGRAGSSRARRLIGVGVATTVTAFLAMTGAGLEVLTQTGLFVAIGLAVAALVSLLLTTNPSETRTLPMERLFWSLPGGLATLGILAVAGAVTVWQAAPGIDRPLFDLPEQVATDLASVQRAARMPATRHLLQVSGDTTEQVLEREDALKQILDQAVKAEEISGYRMARSILPPTSTQMTELPAADTLQPVFVTALQRAGLQPDYATTLIQAYDSAQRTRPVLPGDWRAHPDLAPLLSGLNVEGETASDTVLLFPPLDTDALGARFDKAVVAGVSFEDLADGIWASVSELRATAANWLGIGAAFATLVLVIMLQKVAPVLRIVVTVGAALALTAGLLTAFLGSLTVFQIVALTLVVGIGVDYALFLDPGADPAERRRAARSVSLCAISTLLAFVTMAWSDVRVMGEIGLTVSLGVLMVIVLSLGMMGRRDRPISSEN